MFLAHSWCFPPRGGSSFALHSWPSSVCPLTLFQRSWNNSVAWKVWRRIQVSLLTTHPLLLCFRAGSFPWNIFSVLLRTGSPPKPAPIQQSSDWAARFLTLGLYIWSHYGSYTKLLFCNLAYISDKGVILKNTYLFIYLSALGLSCGMWDLVPRPGIKPRPPALVVQSLSHWTTREGSQNLYFNCYFIL